ncbi:hypothetical protein RHSIM_Rhsim11G0073100 [Rhododendron simsii]|uniref:Uncharacterized protein n=1 Tax=Rhododendron simsii TaxID=118357 RepID=A0A834G817_RHOSS|nr:hypothetical protein RHSIM_Rhsim11G0073100 [Rhododendron simsii]
MGLNPDEGAVGAGSEPRFKPKPNYVSLIPPKRKLVKKMMWDRMVRATSSCFSGCCLPVKNTFATKKINSAKIDPAESNPL